MSLPETPPHLPSFLGDPLEFCAMLRDRHGFVIGVPTLARVNAVLSLALRRDWPIATATDLHRLLSPVLARDASEQAVLLKELQLRMMPGFQTALAAEETEQSEQRAATGSARATQASRETAPTAKPSRRLAGPIGAFAVFLALVIWGVMSFTSTGISPTPEPDRPDVPNDASLSGSFLDTLLASALEIAMEIQQAFGWAFWLVVAALVGLFAATFVARAWMRNLTANRALVSADHAEIPLAAIDAGPVFFASHRARDRIERLARHRHVVTTRPDMPATLRASLRAGNVLRIVMQTRKRQPEFIVLFDRAHVDDLMQIAVADFAAALRGQAIHLRRFDYALDPSFLTEIDAQGNVIGKTVFRDLMAQADGREVLLFADPRDLTPPGRPDTLQPWVAGLAAITSLTVVSPVPLARLGGHVARMGARFDFSLVSAQDLVAGQTEFAGHDGTDTVAILPAEDQLPATTRLLSETPPMETHHRALRRWLVQNVSAGGREVLAALSIYPQISPGLTRGLGATLTDETGAPLLTAARLSEVAGLSWLRRSYMPQWARALVQSLVPQERRAALADGVRAALQPGEAGGTPLFVVIDRSPQAVRWVRRLLGAGAQAQREAVVARAGSTDPLALLLPSDIAARSKGMPALKAGVLGVVLGALTYALAPRIGLDRVTLMSVLAVLALIPWCLALSQIDRDQRRNLGTGVAWLAGMLLPMALQHNEEISGEVFLVDKGGLALCVAYFLRGARDVARPGARLLQGSTWAGSLVIILAVAWIPIGLIDEIRALTWSEQTFGIALVMTPPLAVFGLWRLGVSIWQAPVVTAAVIAVCLIATQLVLPGRAGVQGPDFALNTGLDLWLPELNGFAAIICGVTWWVCFMLVLGYLDWKGAVQFGRGLLWPVWAALLLTLAMGLPVLCVFAFDATYNVSHAYPLGLMALTLVLPMGAILCVHHDARLGPLEGARQLLGVTPIPDHSLWRAVNASPIIIVSATIVVFFAIYAQLGALANEDLDSIAVVICTPLAVVLARYVGRPAIGTPVWTVYDRFGWAQHPEGHMSRGLMLSWMVALWVFGTYGVYIGAFQISPSILCFPAAFYLGLRYGRAGFACVAVGMVPAWSGYNVFGGDASVYPLRGIADYFTCLLLARFAGSPALRQAVFRCGQLTRWQQAYLGIGMAVGLHLRFNIDANIDLLALLNLGSVYLPVLALLLGLSKVPGRQVAIPVAIGTGLTLFALSVQAVSAPLPNGNDFGVLFSYTFVPTLLDMLAAFWIGRMYRRQSLRPISLLALASVVLLLLVVGGFSLRFFETDVGSLVEIKLASRITICALFFALGLQHGRLGITVAALIDVAAGGVMGLLSAAVNQGVTDVFEGSLWYWWYAPTSMIGFVVWETVSISLGGVVIAWLGHRANLYDTQRKSRYAGLIYEMYKLEIAQPDFKPTYDHNFDWAGLRMAEYEADMAALRSGPEPTPGGHPALEAVWLDKVAVIFGVVMLVVVPLFALLIGA